MVINLERVIEKYEKGIFAYENAPLDFSCAKIEITTDTDQISQGTFQVLMPSEEKLEGYLHTTSSRMQCQVQEREARKIVFSYAFNSNGLEEGTTHKGNISLISPFGEYYIPYVISICHFTMESSIGSIKNLFHFTNLAKTSWEEALKVFYNPSFRKIFNGSDKQYFDLYRGLAHEVDNEQNMDAFLVYVNKKQKMEFLVEETIFDINDINNSSHYIHITKNGWGHVDLKVQVQGDFIIVQKERILEEDFLGNRAALQFVVDEDAMHEGQNEGRIVLEHGLEKMKITITAHKNKKGKKKQLLQLKHEVQADITRYYLDLRTKRIDVGMWAEKSLEIIEQITVLEENNCIARLYQAQILITSDRFNEAKWILGRVDSLIEKETSPLILSYYYYLTTLLNREKEHVNEVADKIEEYCKADESNWRLVWFLLYLKEEYTKNPKKRWDVIIKVLEEGCNSPIMFVEAVLLMNSNPGYLSKLEGVYLRILTYALQNQMLDGGVIEQVLYLVTRIKECPFVLRKILFALYEIKADKELLQEICKLLIRDNLDETIYFKWFEMAIREEFRITRLYEHYFLSMPLDFSGEIPKTVLLYFAYDCTLPYEKAAKLYGYVYDHREENPEMYRSYREKILPFIFLQLEAGHITFHLAHLYEEFLTPANLNEERGRQLANLLFLHRIVVDNDLITNIVVVNAKLKGEIRYPLQEGEAEIALYGNNYQVFLQDQQGNRYQNEISFTMQRWLSPGKMVKTLRVYDITQIGYAVYLSDTMGNYITITQENEKCFASLVGSKQIINSFKRQIRPKLLQYYYEADMMQEMDDCLNNIDIEDTNVQERAELIRFMILRGMYDTAYDWVVINGTEGLEPKTLYRMASRMLKRGECRGKDDKMLEITYYAFKKGKYDENTLAYLIQYFEGLAKDLRDLWKIAKENSIDARSLEERILIQILFSGAFIGEKDEIFESYCNGEPKERIVNAYLSFDAYEYFVKERLINESRLLYYLDKYIKGKDVNEICVLALTKYLTEANKQRSEKENIFLEQVFIEYFSKGLLLPMFSNIPEIRDKNFGVEDKSFVEYRCNPGSKVVIHYVLESDKGDMNQYRKEEMKQLGYGIFIKEFVLFYGEILQYYITEEKNGTEHLTESGKLSKSDIAGNNAETRYTQLNDLAISKTLQDYETLRTLAKEYSQKSYVTRKMFRLI